MRLEHLPVPAPLTPDWDKERSQGRQHSFLAEISVQRGSVFCLFRFLLFGLAKQFALFSDTFRVITGLDWSFLQFKLSLLLGGHAGTLGAVLEGFSAGGLLKKGNSAIKGLSPGGNPANKCNRSPPAKADSVGRYPVLVIAFNDTAFSLASVLTLSCCDGKWLTSRCK